MGGACLGAQDEKTKTGKPYGNSCSLDAGRTAPNGGVCHVGAETPHMSKEPPCVGVTCVHHGYV